jgi:hypothetical protein
MKTHDLDTTTQYDEITWNGNGFDEPMAQDLWKRLPEILKEITETEIRLGNSAISILENRERNIVLLSLRKGPLSEEPEAENIKVHRKHRYGNYCYDGTKATYEELNTGCFLAFEDPEYEEDAF